ncbi:hypothetical protein MTQ01_13795 [Streptomyces sp. XM4193]|uniref:hypothetical protein n=1 Tax=Streptomyces sp. XM4193 TaxID=2929782 RepID=UPI001FF8F557|nr:hypothetical protein [Streptomyces sp. XM4193]MCK1797071.1 hypothetical protein [Streptomyces sp. XM4193]
MTRTDLRSDLRTQPWALIAALGAVGLVRPVLSIIDAYDSGPLEKPVGPILFTVLIAVAWVGAAVVLRIAQPVLTLALVGVAYGVFATVLNIALQPIKDDAELIPVPGMIAMIFFNALQGAVLGLIALGLQRATGRAAR